MIWPRLQTLAKRWRFIRVVLSWTESNLDTEVIGFASHNESSLPPTLPYQVFSTIPVKVSFLSLFFLFLGKRHAMEQKKETIHTNANMQSFGGREIFLLLLF